MFNFMVIIQNFSHRRSLPEGKCKYSKGKCYSQPSGTCIMEAGSEKPTLSWHNIHHKSVILIDRSAILRFRYFDFPFKIKSGIDFTAPNIQASTQIFLSLIFLSIMYKLSLCLLLIVNLNCISVDPCHMSNIVVDGATPVMSHDTVSPSGSVTVTVYISIWEFSFSLMVAGATGAVKVGG